MESVSKQADQPALLLLNQLSRLVGDIVWRISDQTELPQMGIETLDGLVAYLCSTVIEQAMNTVSSLKGDGPFKIVHREGSPESLN